MALADHFEWRDWSDWDTGLARREPGALRIARERHASRIAFWKFCQWNFFRQWERLKAHANERGVQIVGDAPIFIAYQSAECGRDPNCSNSTPQASRRRLRAFRPTPSAPPDSAGATRSTDGPRMRRKTMRGGSSGCGEHWNSSTSFASITSAVLQATGKFRSISRRRSVGDGYRPGAPLFQAIARELGDIPIIAEDLGVITPDVDALRKQFGLPGMRILQFAFDSGSGNHFLPHTTRAIPWSTPARTTTTPRSDGGTRHRA